MQGPGAWLWSEASNAMTWTLLQAKRAASPASGGEGTTASVAIVAPCREAARGKGVRWSPSPQRRRLLGCRQAYGFGAKRQRHTLAAALTGGK